MGVGNCVGRAGRRVDTSASGGRLDSSSVVHVVCVLGGGLYVQTAGAHG